MRLGLIDVTGDGGIEQKICDPISEVAFCSGQTAHAGAIENDLERTMETVMHGWNSIRPWALLLLDLHFRTGRLRGNGEAEGRDQDRDPARYFGLELLEAISQSCPELPVLIFSSMGRDDVSRRFADLAAVGFLPRETADRGDLVAFLRRYGLLQDDRKLSEENEARRIVGRSVPLLHALREARQFATGDGNVMLLGDTGTGKELLARYIHDVSPHCQGPFEILFTQDTSESILEDKLFGHEKGAYTGASEARPGIAELANDGTLFIDEFGDIPPGLQNRLLRLLDLSTRETQRQGSNRKIRLRLQVVLATNADIPGLEASGGFRSDLLHRIAGRIELPPLHERKRDIPLLAEHFLSRAVHKYKARQRIVAPETLRILEASPWLGNVRELQQTIDDAVRRFPDVEHLVPAHLRMRSAAVSAPSHELQTPATPSKPKAAEMDLKSLVEFLEEYRFPSEYAELEGMLPAIQRAFAKFLAAYLKAALLSPGNRRFSPGKPEGENNITGAVKCISGSRKLSTSKAADKVKRLLQHDDEVAREVMQDPVLGPALAEAIRLRPKGPKEGRDHGGT